MLSTNFFLRLENRACFPTVKAEIGVCLSVDLAVMGFLRSTMQSQPNWRMLKLPPPTEQKA